MAHPWITKYQKSKVEKSRAEIYKSFLNKKETCFFDARDEPLPIKEEYINNHITSHHKMAEWSSDNHRKLNLPKFKHVGLDQCILAHKKEAVKDYQKRNIIEKYKTSPSKITIGSLEKWGVYKVDNNGNWDLVAKCDTTSEAEEEVRWRAEEFNIEINKQTKIAEAINKHKGTYLIFPIFEIK